MNKIYKIISKASLAVFAIAAVTLITSPVTEASRVSSVSPAAGDVEISKNGNFVLTINLENDGDIHRVEVDHSFEGTIPEFHLVANESNPYGDESDRAAFNGLGVYVTYSSANNRWVVDFGRQITEQFLDRGNVTFYFALKDSSGAYIWGSMSPTSPENTFRFDLTESEEESTTNEDDEEVSSITPGVPNTGQAESGKTPLIAGGLIFSLISLVVLRKKLS